MLKIPEFTVVVDTREQKPYIFKNSIVATLKTGDYSIKGIEDLIAIERKTKADAYGSFGNGRERFERELKRLSGIDYAAIIIEDNLPNFIKPPEYSRLHPKSAINSVIAWSVKYHICVFFSGDRRHGNAVAVRLLEKYWKYYYILKTDKEKITQNNEKS